MNNADRFRPMSSLSPAERQERLERYHSQNITAKQLRPLLNLRFRPVLKQQGFQRATDSLSFRTTAAPYVHFISIRFSSTFPGRFHVKAGIALDFLPMSLTIPFNPKKVELDSDCLFTTFIALPNGNHDIDNGRNEAEAHETIDVLLEAFAHFEASYFRHKFSAFPEPVNGLGIPFIEEITRLVKRNEESSFGSWGATEVLFVYRLALIHKRLSNYATALSLVQYGLSHYAPLYLLQPLYEDLERELKMGSKVGTITSQQEPL
jgi:hypothetical protein